MLHRPPPGPSYGARVFKPEETGDGISLRLPPGYKTIITREVSQMNEDFAYMDRKNLSIEMFFKATALGTSPNGN